VGGTQPDFMKGKERCRCMRTKKCEGPGEEYAVLVAGGAKKGGVSARRVTNLTVGEGKIPKVAI